MAFLQIDFFSSALQVGVSVNAIMPEAAAGAIGIDSAAAPDPPVLYLLHGLSDDHTIWMRRTSVERYAAAHGLAVVMPAVGRSFYCDMASGPAYWQYVSEELPAFVEQSLQVGRGRDKRFVAGLSMGGYGAMKLALTFPDRFAAAASFSGALDMRERTQGGDLNRDMRLIFGDRPRVAGTQNDTFHLAESTLSRGTALPALYISCGTEDFLFEANERFHEHLVRLGIEHDYVTEPGEHEWGFWDRHVRAFLDRLAAWDLV